MRAPSVKGVRAMNQAKSMLILLGLNAITKTEIAL